ncbi:MAG TPA: hypothetical protein DHM37_02075, partial [Candidatus Cloacimonas sp.]|nr:hypothetical protein [Candidatus Cloacimonas sp.]
MALFSTTAGFFGNIATFHYDSAIMLPVEDKDAINVLALSVGLTALMSLVSLIVVVFFNSFLVNLMKNENISFWLYFVPISVFFMGTFRSFSVWVTRHKQFKLIALRNITQTTSTAGTKITFGWADLQNIGLITGTLVGQTIATLLLIYESFKKTIINLKYIKLPTIFSNAKKYKDFPLFTNWQGFLDVFNESGLKIIISNFAGASVLGLYSFTLGMLLKPLRIIGESVSNVFYQHATHIYNKGGDLLSLTLKLYK